MPTIKSSYRGGTDDTEETPEQIAAYLRDEGMTDSGTDDLCTLTNHVQIRHLLWSDAECGAIARAMVALR